MIYAYKTQDIASCKTLSGADGLCWDLYLQVGLPFEKCKGIALTKNGDIERPVPAGSSLRGSTLFVSFILFIYFLVLYLDYS